MEINKRLFEDVLSGKLKGTFVLRDGKKIESKCLRKNYSSKFCYCFTNEPYPFTCNGYTRIQNIPDEDDVIDFIVDGIDPEMYLYNEKDVQFVEHFIKDNHMKENELAIEIPKGKIVDWDESKKQNKIVLKNKQLTYENICEKLFKNRDIFYIRSDGGIQWATYSEIKSCICDETNATTEHQLECILAKNKLANVCKFLNGDTDYSTIESCWGFDIVGKMIRITYYPFQEPIYYQPQFVCKSKELAQQAIEILGEETVKLALEPLGI